MSFASTLAGTPPDRRIIAVAVVILAALLTLKYFPGLEYEPMYAGAAYQIIHPDAFQGDPYRSPDVPLLERPIHLSLMYGLVKIVGAAWLDDRFLALVYLGLVVASLVGVDRIARLLGAEAVEERLIVLLMFMRDHQILTGKVLLAYHADVNHTAFAVPIIVWLLYAALARKGLAIVLGLAALLTLTSVRAALFPILFALAVVFALGTARERWTVAALCAVGVAVMAWGLTVAFPIAEANRLEIWELIKEVENNDANPFLGDGLGPLPLRYLAWGVILGAAFFLTPHFAPAHRGVRVVIVCGVAVMVLGGLYIEHAPDALKQPLLISFVPARSLAWPQNLAYIALTISTLKILDARPDFKRLVVGGLALAALFVAGPGNLDRWAGLLVVAVAAALAINALRRDTGAPLGERLRRHWRAVALHALVLAVVVAYGVAAAEKAPAWATALDHGVFGNNPTARWIGVADYFRDRTPPGTSVLAFHCADGAACKTLKANRSLATRSGRAMPTPEDISADFRDPESWKRLETQTRLLEDAGRALAAGRAAEAAAMIDRLVLVPDYLVIPDRIAVGGGLPYAEETRIAGYRILKRNAAGEQRRTRP